MPVFSEPFKLVQLSFALLLAVGFNPFSAQAQAQEKSDEWEANTHILFVFDASNSMNAFWQGKRKIEVATELLSESLGSLYGIPGLKLGLWLPTIMVN